MRKYKDTDAAKRVSPGRTFWYLDANGVGQKGVCIDVRVVYNHDAFTSQRFFCVASLGTDDILLVPDTQTNIRTRRSDRKSVWPKDMFTMRCDTGDFALELIQKPDRYDVMFELEKRVLPSRLLSLDPEKRKAELVERKKRGIWPYDSAQ